MCFGIRILVRYIPSANSAYIPKADVEALPETGSAVPGPPPRPVVPPPSTKFIANRETAPVTPVRGPRSMELGSGKVAGKVLIVEHM